MEDDVPIRMEKAEPKRPVVNVESLLPPGKSAMRQAEAVKEAEQASFQDQCIFVAKCLVVGGVSLFVIHKGYFYLKKGYTKYFSNGKLPDPVPSSVLANPDAFVPRRR